MHYLEHIAAQEHITDLRRTADHDRLVRAAIAASRSDAASAGLPGAGPPVTLIRRLLRRLVPRQCLRLRGWMSLTVKSCKHAAARFGQTSGHGHW
jgi:hypothetical protein